MGLNYEKHADTLGDFKPHTDLPQIDQWKLQMIKTSMEATNDLSV